MTDAPTETIERLRHVVGVVTSARLLSQTDLTDVPPVIALGFDAAAPIRASGSLRGAKVSARVRLSDETAEGLGGVVCSYAYALLDRNETELLAYHWHPGSRFAAPPHPHLHVSAALRPAAPDGSRGVLPLDKVHLPTGPVPLAAFARMLVEEFSVEPRVADWAARLAQEPAAG